MSNRLDQQRQKELEPERMDYAIKKLTKLGFAVTPISSVRLSFEYKGETVNFWPYSGWASGKSIKDGRGIKDLLNQVKY